MRSILPALLGAVLAVLALYALGWGPRSSAPAFPTVIVDSAQVVQGEPTASPGLLGRAVRPVARPEVRATAPGAAAGDVLAFCAAAGWISPGAPASNPGDTDSSTVPAVALPTPTPGIPPALTVQPSPIALALMRSARIDLRVTDAWLIQSSGDLMRSTHRVRPPVTLRVSGDTVVVQGAPWWLWGARALAPLVPCAAGGILTHQTGSVVPVAVGCALGASIAVR